MDAPGVPVDSQVCTVQKFLYCQPHPVCVLHRVVSCVVGMKQNVAKIISSCLFLGPKIKVSY